MVNNDIHYIRKEVDNLQAKMSEFNVRTEYAQNQSDTNPPTTGWSEIRPSSAEGYFIWVRNIMNMGYGDVISEPYCVGDGLEHITGLDVEYISWADPYEKPPHSAEGWQTTAPSLTWGHYIWSRTKIITTEQITYTDPVRITGDASEEIAVGNGYPSDNKYVHVVYSDVNNPQDWNQCFRYPANHKYVGVVVTNDEGYVTIPSMYSWSEYNPTKGYSVGNGKYFHIKYSNNENGVDANNNADMNDKGGLFIGYCTTTNINDPNTPATYTWIRLEGKGILEIIEHYAESTHYDTAPTTGWSTSPPIFRAGYFYWTKSVIYYTDSTTYSTTPICVSGVDGTGVHYVYFCKDEMVTPSTPTWSDIHANSSTMSQNYNKWVEDPVPVTEDYPYIYISTSTEYDAVHDEWNHFSIPSLWSKWGADGEDGEGFEIVFYQSSDVLNWNSSSNDYRNPYKLSSSVVSSAEYQTADYVPFSGQTYAWSDDAQGVDADNPFEYACTRTKNNEGVWSAFSKPFMWSKYGNDGKDGKGFEIVFYQTNDLIDWTNSSNDYRNPTKISTSASGFQEEDYVPWKNDSNVNKRWTDDAVGISSNKAYEYASTRTKGENGLWSAFTKPFLWANYSTSIKDVTNYYLATSYSANVGTSDGAWGTWSTDPTSTNATMTSTKKYLWNYEVVIDENNDVINTTSPCIIGRYGDTGGTGKGISSIVEHYAVSSTLSTPSSWVSPPWTNSNPMPTTDGTNKYLWNYETINWTSGSPTDTGKRVISVHGEKGDRGIDGKAVEYIFYRTNSKVNWASITSSSSDKLKNPVNWTGTSYNDGGTTKRVQDDDFYLASQGWADDMEGVDKNHVYEYCSIRRKTPNASGVGVWGAFSEPVLWGVYVAPIKDVINYYLASASGSGVTTSTSGWTTTIQAISSAKPYLWNYEVIKDSDGTVINTTAPVIIGRFGTDGRSVSSVTNYYLATASSSGVTTSTSGWTTTVQDMDSTKKYLWNYEVIKDAGGSTISSTSPCVIGRYGTDGKHVSSITEYYAISNSTTAPADSSFSTTVQTTTTSNKYLWNYEVFTYSDSSTSKTTKRIISTHGTNGKGITDVQEYYAVNNNKDSAPANSSFSTTVVTTTETNRYLWNYEVLTYTDNTTYTSPKRIISTHGERGTDGQSVDVPTLVDATTDELKPKLDNLNAKTLDDCPVTDFIKVVPESDGGDISQNETNATGTIECRKLGLLVIISIRNWRVVNKASDDSGWQNLKQKPSTADATTNYVYIPAKYRPSADRIVGGGSTAGTSSATELRLEADGSIRLKRKVFPTGALNDAITVYGTFVFFTDTRTGTYVQTNASSDLYVGDNFTITLKESGTNNVLANKNVNVVVNGVKYARKTNGSGQASVKMNLPANKDGNTNVGNAYTVGGEFNGDSTHKPSSASVNTFRLKWATPTITNTTASTVNRTTPITGTVKNDNDNTIKGVPIKVTINGNVYNTSTLTNGNFSVQHPNDGLAYNNTLVRIDVQAVYSDFNFRADSNYNRTFK